MRAACRTEIKGQGVAALGRAHPLRSLTGEADLLAAEARLVANHGARTALALQTVAHGDARRFRINRKVKLPAAAGGVSGGHGSSPRGFLHLGLVPATELSKSADASDCAGRGR
jgi:hypothetical protein